MFASCVASLEVRTTISCNSRLANNHFPYAIIDHFINSFGIIRRLEVDMLKEKQSCISVVALCGLLICNADAQSSSADPAQVTSDLQGNLVIGHFSQGRLDDWQVKEFAGFTDYKIITDANTTKHVLMANSHHSASGLFKEQRIDLQKTPYLHWSWKTKHLYSHINERSKQGDDFVARLYIVVDGGLFIWKTRALNYVWSTSSAKGESWANPYTDKAMMLAVESGEQNLGQWISYQRNVRDDLKTIVGKEVRYIDAIAVMTDSDNAGQQATTYYGDIYFSAQP